MNLEQKIMAETMLGPVAVHTIGELPVPGTIAPDFTLADRDLKDVALSEFAGRNLILNIFPSVDTRVCATSVREFNKRAAALSDTSVLCVSRDLPFALNRFCGAEGIDNVRALSDFRSKDFGTTYGVELVDGAFRGLLARAIIVIDKNSKIVYTELVPSIGQEPDYDRAIASIS